MKYVLVFFFLPALCSLSEKGDFCSLSFTTLEGKKIETNSLKGRKILVVIIPSSEKDTAIDPNELIDLQKRYDTSLFIIGIPAEEMGYSKKNEPDLTKLYANRGANFFITESMKVTKESKEAQSPLFQWLTNHNSNKHFDFDVRGIGQKFFIDESGELCGVLGPEVKMSSEVIYRILDNHIKKPEAKFITKIDLNKERRI